MGMLPHWYLEGRILAELHVQVELPQPIAVTTDREDLALRAKVVRVFRGGSLREGDEICFDLGVVARGFQNEGLRPVFAEEVNGARYLELFLEDKQSWHSKHRIVRQQVAAVAAPTDAPTMTVPTKAEIAAMDPSAGIDRLDIV